MLAGTSFLQRMCLHRLACVRVSSTYVRKSLIQQTVSQKKDIKRQKAKLEALKQEAEEERARARSEARERVLREFERGQGLAAGLAGLRKESDKSTGDGAGACVRLGILASYSLPSRIIQLPPRSVN